MRHPGYAAEAPKEEVGSRAPLGFGSNPELVVVQGEVVGRIGRYKVTEQQTGECSSAIAAEAGSADTDSVVDSNSAEGSTDLAH